jgi:PD-(D/E)XK nuclease superfamily
MTRPLSDPAPEPKRDHWGRPYVVPPGGGKPVPYTRTTTFVGAVEDRMALGRWQQRMTAIGIVDRKDLMLAVAAHRDDKKKLDSICEQALEAAKGKAGATTGTALHALTEQQDRGQQPIIPDDYVADMAAYLQATADMRAIMIEQFCVMDPLKVAGTPDRIVEFEGKRYIADLKTGSIEYGFLTIAAQLAMYARSRPYDVATNERMEPHGAELDRGIVIHLPAGQGICIRYWVDLLAGWQVIRVARDVRQYRQLRFPQLLKELHPVPVAPPVREEPPTLVDELTLLINAAESPQQVRDLWRASTDRWTDRHTELAKQHIAELERTTTLSPSTPERSPV